MKVLLEMIYILILPEFLKPENIKDLKGNRPDSPEYDYSTLYVPSSFLKNH